MSAVSLLVGMEQSPWHAGFVVIRADQGGRSSVTFLATVVQVIPGGGEVQLNVDGDGTDSW